MTSALKEKIIERMEAKNLSIAELERRAGLSIHSVRNILKGRIKKPSAQSLQAIAEALECSLMDLVNASSPSGEDASALSQHKKISPPVDYPELMLECSKAVLTLIGDCDPKATVDEYLDIVKKVYFYSSKEEPRKSDIRFAEWLIETQLGSRCVPAKE
ncbi:MAG: helix-turn-helix transcriptional regulator [Proteobacteria bacterium]|nr:helix-turn-helix transcriptional regulator [Pseudomonadota bacterium]